MLLRIESTSQKTSRLVQPFLQNSQQSVPILYNGPPFPLKIVSSYRDWTPSNTWFIGPTRVHNPNDITIVSAVFAGLTIVTDRQTNHASPSVIIGRSTAMRPNNKKEEKKSIHTDSKVLYGSSFLFGVFSWGGYTWPVNGVTTVWAVWVSCCLWNWYFKIRCSNKSRIWASDTADVLPSHFQFPGVSRFSKWPLSR